VKCGLKINYAVTHIINPALKAQYPSANYEVKQVVGIDTSEICVARTGVRGDNDLVWVGCAANYAGKLTELDLGPSTWITKEVFEKMNKEVKFGGQNNELMWKKWDWSQMDNIEVHSSTWWWRI
jgi:class 3 adenylate cyclase